MNLHASALVPNGSSEPAGVRWIFRKGDQSLTCLLQRSAASSFDVGIVPHWDVSSAVIEKTETSIDAFCRHAEIAMRLRSAGWSVVARSN